MAAGSAAAVERPALVVESGLHRAGGGALETTVDQALIRGLGTAFRVCVSGLSSCLESGRRAAPGHITSDGGSPSVAPSPALCSGVRLALGGDGPGQAFIRSQRSVRGRRPGQGL